MTVSTIGSWRPSAAYARAVIFGLAGVTASLLFRSPTLLIFAMPFAVVAVWSAVTRPDGEPVLAGDIAPRSVREGEATTWTGRLTNVDEVDHAIALASAHRWIETRPLSGATSVDTRLGDAEASLSLPMRAMRWGRHSIGPIKIVAVSSWGAFRWQGHDAGYRIGALPLPAVFDASHSTLRANGLIGLNRSSRPGDGSEFAGIRPFQAGDRLRRINWQRSLRNQSMQGNQLYVTATLADQDSHVALFVDALGDFGPSDGVDGAASSLDTTVRAAGAITEHFLVRGDRVSLRVWDSRFTTAVPPGSGSSHLRRALDVLASIEPGPSRLGPGSVANSVVSGGALVIVLSPLISSVALERAISMANAGLAVAVIDTLPPDLHRSNDAKTDLAWRIRLLERRREVRAVQRAGVPLVEWQGPGSLDPFMREMARRAAAPRMARR